MRDVPDKADELAGDRDAGFVLMDAARLHAAVTSAQAQLRTPGNIEHGSGLSFVAYSQVMTELRRVAIGPCGLDEKPTHMGITGLGDAALTT